MKLRKSIIFSLFFTLLISLTIIPYSLSYYGDGDCTQYHTGKTINVPYDPNAIIQLDGLPNEQCWNNNKNQVGRTQINVSTTDRVITTVNMSFVMNDNYILILCTWPDLTTLPDTQDGFYICWNINVPNFSAYYPAGMSTTHMGGGYIDSWMWNINYDSPINNSDDYCKDSSYGTGGDTGENDLITIQIGYTTFIDSHYSIEIRRKLATAEKNLDVQFDQTRKYGFNLGILNDSAFGHDHSISYTHYLDISFDGSIDGFLIYPFLLGITIISLIYLYKKRSLKYKN